MYGRERTRGKFNHSLEENKEIDRKSLIVKVWTGFFSSRVAYCDGAVDMEVGLWVLYQSRIFMSG